MQEVCDTCPFILRILESCPSLLDNDRSNLDSILQGFWVLASVTPIILTLLIISLSLYQRTSRVFCFASIIVIGEISIVILKEIFRMPRPNGACSTTFGFPSGHAAGTTFVTTW